ncbi:MAG: hypothetical protein ABJF10_28075 [Chthoniobacter sp.]|uniref:hypothetical protein n=1 Tax=Chthoniobacter sp. TaxID=2510640 RepID=UPI0032A7EBC7
MGERLEALLGQKRFLEQELIREARKKEAEFCYEVHEKAVHFTEAARVRHKQLRLSVHCYLLDSSFLVLLTAPVIWMCLIPIGLLDLIGSIYQAVCFPIYGIPKVVRREYLTFDRHHLTYLNFIEKLNCEYCAYGNGILAYFTEIAARTEQHWCPIKHAGCSKCAHSRYKNFVEFGDAEKCRQHVEEIRRSYQDIKNHESPREAK